MNRGIKKKLIFAHVITLLCRCYFEMMHFIIPIQGLTYMKKCYDIMEESESIYFYYKHTMYTIYIVGVTQMSGFFAQAFTIGPFS